jgi:DNA gyrase/topoisomerase IV subunit B
MFTITTTKKIQELEDALKKQEQEFEERLRIIQTEFLEYNAEISQELIIAKANEKLLNEQTAYLSTELQLAKSISFPTKKFSISKAITLLTTDLSDKALATFLNRLVQVLGQSHLESLNKYVTDKLNKNGI